MSNARRAQTPPRAQPPTRSFDNFGLEIDERAVLCSIFAESSSCVCVGMSTSNLVDICCYVTAAQGNRRK